MAFNLGNFTVKEIISGVAEDFSGNLLYYLDQLTSAQIEVAADTTEITDKSGATIRTIYNNKSATFTATSAMISPALLNANSGSAMNVASSTNKIEMPKMLIVAAGSATVIADLKTGTTPKVMGIYANGANGDVLTQSTTASLADKQFAYDSTTTTLTVPAATEETLTGPTMYLIKYQRDVESGISMENVSNVFPDTERLTLYAAIVDPCEDHYKAAYIYIPSFQPDPNVTISLDKDNQEMDFNGNINVDMCGCQKTLYVLYFPEEDAVVTGVTC